MTRVPLRIVAAWMTLAVGALGAAARAPSDAEARLREALFTRSATDGTRFGPAELDILFFSNTSHLLREPTHSAALKALEEFAALDDSRLPADPLHRALLQRDLWQLFDWARGEFTDITDTAEPRAALRQHVAAAMRRVLLTDAQIAKLPDNFDELDGTAVLAGIPRSLRAANGGWIPLGTSGDEPAAPIHTTEQKARSVFFVLVRLPGGRRATRDWLATLQLRKPGETTPVLDRAADAFPPGTTWALVRVMNVIDEGGRIRSTHLIESVQFRRYTDEPPGDRPGFGTGSGGFQHLGELQMDRLQPPHLRALQAWDRVFSRGMNLDMFESRGLALQGREPPFEFCQACHQLMGNRAVRSLVGFEGRATPAFLESSFAKEAAKVVAIKQQRPDWQELSGLWREAR